MATYAVGDIQGCLDEFLELLELIQFDEAKDKIWLTGDLVNRGPNSLETLREIKAMGQSVISVLGNHDLYLIALARVPEIFSQYKHTLHDILSSNDKDQRDTPMQFSENNNAWHHSVMTKSIYEKAKEELKNGN